MGHIRQLSENLANKIAAGEVVERPASVIKELTENSIDAKAKSITILVEQGGTSSMSVIDDGIGMNRTDALLCFSRHATSKIVDENDLFNITTLGFREKPFLLLLLLVFSHLKQVMEKKIQKQNMNLEKENQQTAWQ